MGGKSSTSTSSVAIPAQVLAQYQSVNSAAATTAQTPFQDYSGEFVAPVNSEQLTGIGGVNAAANEAQPYYDAATGTLASTQGATSGVNAAAEYGTAASAAPITGSDINSYLSPYLGDVMSSTEALQNQENQQAQAGQLGDAISSGAFGGDRTGIAAANLQQQEDLANSNVLAGIANTGYTTAQGEANTEQQAGLTGAAQLASIGSTAYGEGANTANELGTLGTGAQTAATTGAEAQLSAGTVQQQTQQAEDTAEYNQFLQQQSYPFQVDEFLAGIAEGTGSLSGSTTTTTSPQGIFSDRRLKRDIKKIGKTFDGQDIYSYKMGDDKRTHIGLMAQDVEKKHPKAVGIAGGFKTVDYGKATKNAANEGHFYRGGVVPFRRHRDTGGGLAGVLQAQQQMYGNMPGGPAAASQRAIAGGSGVGGGHSLAVAQARPAAPPSTASDLGQTMQLADAGDKLYKDFSQPSSGGNPGGFDANAAVSNSDSVVQGFNGAQSDPLAGIAMDSDSGMARGGIAARIHRFGGGGFNSGPDSQTPGAPQMSSPAGDAVNPYASDDGGMNIPTSEQTHTLAAAAPSTPKSTSNQDIDSIIGLVGEFAKRGGRINRQTGGGIGFTRPGFDDGGGIDQGNGVTTYSLDDAPSPNSITTPVGDAEVTASGPPPSAPTGIAPTSSSSNSSNGSPQAETGIKGFWDRNKGTILPILEGLGAMGTTPTIHPGIALAAGIGAAAHAYPEVQKSLADTQEEQALAQGQQIQNKMAGIKAGVMQQAFTPQGGGIAGSQGAPPAPPPLPTNSAATALPSAPASQPSSDAAQTAAGLYGQYQSKYFVNSAKTPEEQAQFDQAKKQDWAVGGGTTFQDIANNDYQQRVNRETLQKTQAARQEASGLYATATDPNADYPTVQTALARYNALFPFTGDTYTDTGGNKSVARTGAPAIGLGAPQLTPQQRADLLGQAQQLVQVPNTDGSYTQMPAWQAHKAPSAQAYAQQLTNFATAAQPGAGGTAQQGAGQGAGAPVAPPVASGIATGPGAAPSRTVRPRVASQAPGAAPTGLPPGATPRAGAAPSASLPPKQAYESRALADTSYRIPTPPVVAGRSQSPMALTTQQTNFSNSKKLLQESDQASTAASTSLQYLRAAQSILNSHGATLGAYADVVKGASQYLPFTGNADASNYVEISKYLGNAAVQAGNANFPNPTQSEIGLQLGELSPNPGMPEQAVRELVAANIRNANYVLDSANRTKSYVNAGNDPVNFQKWNEAYFPREKLTNADAVKYVPSTGQRLYRINGQWVP